MHNVLIAFLVFLPAGIANVSPILFTRVPVLKNWNTPLDFGKRWRGKRLLGDNKTWRGVILGSLLGALTAILLVTIFIGKPSSAGLVIVGWSGLLLGVGALLGDAVESFIKRRVGVKPGKSWFPFDQCDYIIGGLLFSYPIIQWPLSFAAIIFGLYFGLHIVFSYIGFLLGLKPNRI